MIGTDMRVMALTPWLAAYAPDLFEAVQGYGVESGIAMIARKLDIEPPTGEGDGAGIKRMIDAIRAHASEGANVEGQADGRRARVAAAINRALNGGFANVAKLLADDTSFGIGMNRIYAAADAAIAEMDNE